MGSNASYDFERWREPAPFDYEGDYGVGAGVAGGQVWLAAPAGVWSATSPTWADREVTADVLEAEIDLDEYDGRARLVLRNDPTATGAAGRYSGYGEGDLSAIRRGARLQLSPGYNTTVGAEASAGPTFWIESVELETGPRGGLIVRARDGWWLLEQWRARRQFAWPAGDQTVSQIIMLICARAGLDNASLSSSSAFTSLKPAFTIHPGEDGKTALRRLLAMVPDEAIMRGGTCFTRYPQATDASDYAYGGDHAISAGRYRELGGRINRVRVLGDGVFNEGFDFPEIEAMGERISQVLDLNLTTPTLAGNRAAYVLRAAETRERRDEVTVFGLNCGQEVYDVVTLTDAQAGLSVANRRVLGLTWRYLTSPGRRSSRYDMTLYLGSR